MDTHDKFIFKNWSKDLIIASMSSTNSCNSHEKIAFIAISIFMT